MNKSLARMSRSFPFCGVAPRLFALLLVALALGACSKAESPAGPGKAPAGQAGPGAGAAPPPTPVHVITMSPQNVPLAFEAVGQTEGSKQVEVRARVSGILLKRLFVEGTSVRAGAPLFEIDPAPFELALQQARAALAQEQARAAQARREADRLKPLADEKAISRKDYDDAVSNTQLTSASVAQAATRGEGSRAQSFVHARHGAGGRDHRSRRALRRQPDHDGPERQPAHDDQPGESDLGALQPVRIGSREDSRGSRRTRGDQRRAARPGRRRALSGEGAHQLHRDPDRSRSSARSSCAPSSRIRASSSLPGQFVRVRIVAGQQQNVYLVPQTAVMQTEKGHFVFVDDAGKAAIRPVETGEWAGTNWIIRSGLNAGDRVIVDNLIKLRPGAPIVVAPPAPGAPGVRLPGATPPAAAAPAKGASAAPAGSK